MAKYKRTRRKPRSGKTWRSKRPWPILPDNAQCPCPKRGGSKNARAVECSGSGCRYFEAGGYGYMTHMTFLCRHPKQQQTLIQWTKTVIGERQKTELPRRLRHKPKPKAEGQMSLL